MAGASIADLFARLVLDATGFEADVVKTADKAAAKAGTTASSKFGSTFKNGLKVVGGAASLFFTAAATGAAQLEDVAAGFQAATGSTAAEAKAAAKDINAIAGDTRQSLDTVSEAAIAVRQNLGVTGQAATDLTRDFVDYARVTKQDVVGAVKDLDDVIDAYGLKADDTRVIQDKLLVSQQKYGGSITESQKALSDLAPALQAANLGYDDGIALLNLFQGAGVDSAKATTGLTRALNKVKSPEELKKLIDQIRNTPDDFERARLASDLFGAKAGPALANALRPGTGALGDYKISAEEAAGATDKARDAIDSTFSAKIQRAISQVGAAVRGFGADFGPALTGAASLASLLGSVFGPGAIGKLLGPIARLGSAIGTRLFGAIASSVASDAAVSAIGKGLESSVEGGVTGLKGSSKLGKATSGLGKFLGSGLGKALSVGFAAVAVVELAQVYGDIQQGLSSQSEQIGKDIGTQIAQGSLTQLQQSKAALEQGIKDLNGVWDAGLFTNDQRAKLQKNLDDVNAKIAAMQAKASGNVVQLGQDADRMATAVGTAGDRAATGLQTPISAAVTQTVSTVKTSVDAIVASITGIPTRTSAVPGALGTQGTTAAANFKNPFPGAIGTVVSGLLGIPTRTAGVPGALGHQGTAAAAGFKSPFPGAVSAIVGAIVGIPGRTSKVDDQITAQGDAGARGFKGAFSGIGGAVASKFRGIPGSIKRDLLPSLLRVARQLLAAFAGVFAGAHVPAPHVGGGGGGKRAAGGPVEAGESYLVGEQRPELFVPAVSGRIIPRVPALASGSNTVTWAPTLNFQQPTDRDVPTTTLRSLRQLARVRDPRLMARRT